MDLVTARRHLRRTCRAAADDAAVATALRELLDPLDADLRAAVLRHAYWHEVDVPTAALAQAAGGEDALRSAAGRGPVVATCRHCGRAIRATDRDGVLADAPSLACGSCRRPGPRPSIAADAPSAWEFEPQPAPWRSRPLPVLVTGRRQWAEDYPERRPA